MAVRPCQHSWLSQPSFLKKSDRGFDIPKSVSIDVSQAVGVTYHQIQIPTGQEAAHVRNEVH